MMFAFDIDESLDHDPFITTLPVVNPYRFLLIQQYGHRQITNHGSAFLQSFHEKEGWYVVNEEQHIAKFQSIVNLVFILGCPTETVLP